MQQELGAAELGCRGGLDSAGAHPPRWVDLVPAVLHVRDPGADDLDPRAFRGDGDARPVLRDDLDDEVVADLCIPVCEQALVARIRPQVDVHVAVVGLELDLPHRPDRDPAAALHLQPLWVVDAGERAAAAAVGRGRGSVAAEGHGGDVKQEQEAENHRRAPHLPSVPAASRRRKSHFWTRPGAGLHLHSART